MATLNTMFRKLLNVNTAIFTNMRIEINEKKFLKGIFVLCTAYAYINPIRTESEVEQIHSKKVFIAAFFQISIEKTCLKSSMSGESRTQIKGKRMKTVKKRKTANQMK